MRAEMVALAVVPEVFRPWAQFFELRENMTGSGSVIDAPLSTAKIRASLRPRISLLRARGSRRLAGAAPRQVNCSGNESDLIRRPQSSNAEPYETTRYKGDNPGSCFVAGTARRWRGLAGIGIRRRHAK